MNGINHDRINQFVKTWVVWALTGCMTAACMLEIFIPIYLSLLHIQCSDWRTPGDHPRSAENIFFTLEHEHNPCAGQCAMMGDKLVARSWGRDGGAVRCLVGLFICLNWQADNLNLRVISVSVFSPDWGHAGG